MFSRLGSVVNKEKIEKEGYPKYLEAPKDWSKDEVNKFWYYFYVFVSFLNRIPGLPLCRFYLRIKIFFFFWGSKFSPFDKVPRILSLPGVLVYKLNLNHMLCIVCNANKTHTILVYFQKVKRFITRTLKHHNMYLH